MHLFLLAIISMSPLYIYKVYKNSIVFIESKEFKLKKYKVDSIFLGTPSGYFKETSMGYKVFFKDKREKINISAIGKNTIALSSRSRKIYKHFYSNILENYINNGNVLENDSIYVWESPSVNKYGFKNEKEIDLSYDKKSLVFNFFLLLITFFSIFYFVKIEKNKRKKNGNNRKNRKLQKQLKKKEQMKYLLDKMNKKTLLIIVLLYPLFSFSQKEYSNIVFSFSEEQSINIFKYSTGFIIKADYNNKEEAVNEYPPLARASCS